MLTQTDEIRLKIMATYSAGCSPDGKTLPDFDGHGNCVLVNRVAAQPDLQVVVEANLSCDIDGGCAGTMSKGLHRTMRKAAAAGADSFDLGDDSSLPISHGLCKTLQCASWSQEGKRWLVCNRTWRSSARKLLYY
ncbi:hypothetical protein GOP47_0017519 [Adiantum capillus-veneris]|uniref:Uncharacterized protein n=1 Tax=Adiantum capillus-veneris TaxID=13818 RepID=A0A9D4UGQ4_ADICA|nr:hypothetical protein GOP47_0017519 [Adiantum capillus-veneris]